MLGGLGENLPYGPVPWLFYNDQYWNCNFQETCNNTRMKNLTRITHLLLADLQVNKVFILELEYKIRLKGIS